MDDRLETPMAGDDPLEKAGDTAYLQELYVVPDPADRPVPSSELLAAIQSLSGPAKAVFERLLAEGFARAVQK